MQILFLSTSHVDVLSTNFIEKMSISNIDINVLSIPHVDKFYTCHMDKKLLPIWGIDNLSI